MNILFLTSECVPFVKTGGLADVSGALPKELSKFGHCLKVIIPLYKQIDIKKLGLKKNNKYCGINLTIDDFKYTYNIWECKKDEVEYYFIECQLLFNRENIYTNDVDEHIRFIFYQYSALNLIQRLQWKPDIIHLNDWQTSLVPELLKTVFNWDRLFKDTKTFLSIHNIAYQGSFSAKSFKSSGLPEKDFAPFGKYEHYGNFNFLKVGIISSDIVGTVSPTYALEIETKEYGCGLEDVLLSRGDKVHGILNGIDTDIWNPGKDSLLIKNYNYKTLINKQENKQKLLYEAGLEHDDKIPLFGIVSRLAWQKGFEIFENILDNFLKNHIQFIILGSGDQKYVKFFNDMMKIYKDKLFFYNGYNNKLAHLITGGADYFIMPSRYEPCGLNQMFSLNYGTVPIVRKTGGLADTVKDFENDKINGNGLVFENFVADELLGKLNFAIELFKDKQNYSLIQNRGMQMDFSWNTSAKKYDECYKKLKEKSPV